MTSKSTTATRLPAEWEPHDGILLAWPHTNSDWQPILDKISRVYLELTRTILRYESVMIVTPQPQIPANSLAEAGIDPTTVRIEKVATNDTWTRDFGPITVLRNNKPVLLNFFFNGWGQKFPAEKDNQVTERLHSSGCFGATPLETIDLILEGGAIESDGRGTLLTTSQCLLNSNRTPQLDKEQIEESLLNHLGAKRVLWLDHGFLAGDDTDSHIDTLARLCPDDTIVYISCDDPQDEHYVELKKMEEQLRQFRSLNDQPYRLVPLPWPQASYDGGVERLPATYANYLVINGAVLVPSYNDPADEAARAAIATAYPEREIIAIDCRPVIWQHGSLHCITMQIPQGVLP